MGAGECVLPSYTTERLLVRPLVADDLDPLFGLIYAEPEVARLFTSYTAYEQVADLHRRKVALNGDSASAGFGYWGVVLRETGVVIGQILLGPPEPTTWAVLPETSPASPLGDEVELGYAFGRAYWSRGYALEACGPIVRYAFEDLGLCRLVNGVATANAASVRLMERLGYRIEPNLLAGGEGWVGVLTLEAFLCRQAS